MGDDIVYLGIVIKFLIFNNGVGVDIKLGFVDFEVSFWDNSVVLLIDLDGVKIIGDVFDMINVVDLVCLWV